MKLKNIIATLLLLSNISCFNALGDAYDEANLDPASLADIDVSPGTITP